MDWTGWADGGVTRAYPFFPAVVRETLSVSFARWKSDSASAGLRTAVRQRRPVEGDGRCVVGRPVLRRLRETVEDGCTGALPALRQSLIRRPDSENSDLETGQRVGDQRISSRLATKS